MRVRSVLLGFVAAATGWGCGVGLSAEAPHPVEPLLVTPSPSSPFSFVTAGEVHGAIPKDWHAFLVDTSAGIRGGFVATPRARGWPTIDGTTIGMSATWVDATRVGVPSDYYYLAANGPLLSRLTTSANCRDRSDQVYLDRRPSFDPAKWSPGHFMATGEGVCRRGQVATRYAYFVAAPGFGPVHEIGIPRSGLYVVVAVVPQERGSRLLLEELMRQTRFGDDGIKAFVRAAT